MPKDFSFKEFTVSQDKCAMKIGTDGVLLGAWAKLNNPFSVLDIGTGTGVIALQIAQRSHAEVVDALEIDEDAYEQAVDNFEKSPWADRLFCYHAGLLEFADEIDDEYDLIISNPPFFNSSYAINTIEEKRALARHTDSLPYEHLLASTSKLLSENGSGVFVVPFLEEEKFIQIAEKFQLFPNRVTRVRGNYESDLKRSLMQFSFLKSDIEVSELVIEKSRHDYTEEYITLVKDFYLKM